MHDGLSFSGRRVGSELAFRRTWQEDIGNRVIAVVNEMATGTHKVLDRHV